MRRPAQLRSAGLKQARQGQVKVRAVLWNTWTWVMPITKSYKLMLFFSCIVLENPVNVLIALEFSSVNEHFSAKYPQSQSDIICDWKEIGYLFTEIRAQKAFPKLLNQNSFISLFQKSLSQRFIYSWFRQRATECSHFGNTNTTQTAWLAAHRQTLAPTWWLLLVLQSFFLFSSGFFCVCFIFCCNVYNTFLYVLPSKANVKNAKNAPLTCIAGLLCMLDASVSHNMSVCVEFFDSCVTVHNCWAFSHSCVSLHQKAILTPPAFLTLGRHLRDVDAVMDWRWTLNPGGPRAGFVKVPLPRSEITYPVTTQMTLQQELVPRLFIGQYSC